VAVAGKLADDGAVMHLSDQSPGEFAALTLTSLAVLVAAAILVTDYRGVLTSYARRCWRFYQRPSYRRLFLWTSRSRAYYADEARVRRTLRLAAVPGLVMGVLILLFEFVSLATGHVS
jgi:hypothetical protein